MENLTSLLKHLLEAEIDFVLVGGYAAVVHGSSQVTHDLDICAVMTEDQLLKLRNALKGLDAKHRMNPNFQPSLEEDPPPGQYLNNYYLRTNTGVLDILEELTDVGTFGEIKSRAVTVGLFGYDCRVISLDDLIAVKRKMNRPKDKFVLEELLAVKERTAK